MISGLVFRSSNKFDEKFVGIKRAEGLIKYADAYAYLVKLGMRYYMLREILQAKPLDPAAMNQLRKLSEPIEHLELQMKIDGEEHIYEEM